MLTLVLLPGMDGTGQLFDSFVAAVGPEFGVKVIAYPTGEPLGYTELAELARAALPVDGSYVILGESFSGPVAIALAATGLPRLKGLVLCCSFVRNPRPMFSGMGAFASWLPVGSVPGAILSPLLLGHFSTKALRAGLARALAVVSPSVLRARLKAVLTVDMSAQLAAVKVPVLYLRASHDRLVPSAASATVAELNTHTRVVEVQGPHLLLQAAPAEAAEAVRALLREIQD